VSRGVPGRTAETDSAPTTRDEDLRPMDRAIAPPAGGTTDWRLQLPEPRRRHLRAWLWSGAALTFLILVVGGITRLTQSGLSIVDWRPLMGVVPPLNEAQWQAAFDAYRQYPEYQMLRRGMSLAEFKFIFFWEYIHRVLARLIGLVFLLPFLLFWMRGYLSAPLLRRSLLLFALGGLQGFMGWFMVSSGLVDRPHVSHFRLAVHLSIAFAIFGCCVWFARDLALRDGRPALPSALRRRMRAALVAVGVLLGAQVFWGALVAGLKAGRHFNTFPLMEGRVLPPEMFTLVEPAWLNTLENPFTVQWIHRVLGVALLAATIALFAWVRRVAAADPRVRRLNTLFAAGMTTQFALGVLTLLLAVPVTLGVVHQAMAMLLFGVWLVWLHRLRAGPPTARPVPGPGARAAGARAALEAYVR
jgi:heme a synthase